MGTGKSQREWETRLDDLNTGILAQWEEAWLMKFNVAKCHSMRVTKHPLSKQIIYHYSLHNQVLENVPSAKYLGITITDDLDWGRVTHQQCYQ